MERERYFATCGRGIEPVLMDELEALGAEDVEAGRGGVYFAGDRVLLYKANLWLRTAIRILVPILQFDAPDTDELYEAVRTIDWTRYLTPDRTLAVDCNVRDSQITHSMYAALRVKDAICDQFVHRCGLRPSVDVENPMVGLNLHIYRNRATLSLDSTAGSLHKRGYRPILNKAPINEALAAAIIKLTRWRPEQPLIDPLCGSGTLPIEAAWMALRRPPGLTRKRFGFQSWMDYDVGLWTELRDEARAQMARTLPATITGSDIRGDAVAFSIDNAKAAGIGHLLRFSKRDIRDFTPPPGPPGVIVCNPPYGERLGEERELVWFYQLLGEIFSQRCKGWSCFVFSGNRMLGEAIGLKTSEEIPLFNGAIPCMLLRFDIA